MFLVFFLFHPIFHPFQARYTLHVHSKTYRINLVKKIYLSNKQKLSKNLISIQSSATHNPPRPHYAQLTFHARCKKPFPAGGKHSRSARVKSIRAIPVEQ